MWKNILKGQGKAKKLNFNFLKEVSLGAAEGFKGKTLSRDEFLDFLKQIRRAYSVRHKAIPLDRIQDTVIKILKQNELEQKIIDDEIQAEQPEQSKDNEEIKDE